MQTDTILTIKHIRAGQYQYKNIEKSLYICSCLLLRSAIKLRPIRLPALSQKIVGAVSIRKTVLPGMAIPMLKIRRPNGRLIFNMEIAIRR